MVRALTVVAALVAAAGAVSAAGDGTAPSRVVDRTFACTLFALPGGVRDLDVAISTGLEDPTSNLRAPAQIELASGVNTLDNNLVYVRTRAGAPYGGRTFPPGAYANTKRCTALHSRIPLSQQGLPGPPVQWSTGTQCRLRGRALVRVRAVLRAPATWRVLQPPYAGARVDVLEATVAVRSERGRKPILFGQLTRSGGMRFLAAAACD